MIARIYTFAEYLRAMSWCYTNLSENRMDWCEDDCFYNAYDFGNIRFWNQEDFTYFMFVFAADGNCIAYDPDGDDPYSVKMKRMKGK